MHENELRLYIVRHGHSVANYSHAYSGQSNVPLAPDGFDDARSAGRLLRDIVFTKVYCSELLRARQTCEAAMPGTEYETDSRLNEVSVGDLAGVMPEDAQAKYGEVHAWARAHRDFTAFGGENHEIHFSRTASFMREMEHSGLKGNVAVFCHDGTIRTMLDYTLGALVSLTKVRIDNGSISVLVWKDGRWLLERWNMTEKLT